MQDSIYKLKIVKGFEKGKSFVLAGDVYTIGRSRESTICILDILASKDHCEILRAGSAYYIKDLGSRNGTFLDESRLDPLLNYELQPGSEIKIGRTVIRVELDEQADRFEALHVEDTAVTEIEFISGKAAGTGHREIVRRGKPGRFKEGEQEKVAFLTSSSKSVSVMNQMLSIAGSTLDRNILLEKSMDLIMENIEAERGFVYLAEDLNLHILNPVVKRIMDGDEDVPDSKVSNTVITTMLNEGEALLSTDVSRDRRFSSADSFLGSNIGSIMCAPIKCEDKNIAIIYLDTTSQTTRFRRADLELLTAIGIFLGILIKEMDVILEFKETFIKFAQAMVNVNEAKKEYMYGHSERVAAISLEIASELNVSQEEKEVIHLASLLHDIGYVSVPDEILNKPGKLSEEEYDIVKHHPIAGRDLFQDVKKAASALDGVLHHHERFDGKGYPDGLAGEDIPMVARIIAVADAFEAMTSDRPYRDMLSEEKALAELLKNEGSQFDGKIVQAFHRAFKKDRIPHKT